MSHFTASRTVFRDALLYCSLSASSVGSWAPGLKTPDLIFWRRSPAICRYMGSGIWPPICPNNTNRLHRWVDKTHTYHPGHRNSWPYPIAFSPKWCHAGTTRGWDESNGSNGRVHRTEPSSPGAWERKDMPGIAAEPDGPCRTVRQRLPGQGGPDRSPRERRWPGKGNPSMAVTVVLAAAMLAALFMLVFVVTMQIHREERLYREERRAWEERRHRAGAHHRAELLIPLTRPARGRWAQFARSACGVYIYGMG